MFCTGWHSHQKVDQGKFQNSLVMTLCQERTLLKRITRNGWVTRISKLRTRDALTRGKILFALLASFRGQIFKNKIPFTPKCLRLKWLLRRTQWSHGRISLRTMGLGPEGVGSSGPGFLNLSMQNVSLIGVGWPLKNSNIFFTETTVSGKDFVYLRVKSVMWLIRE